MQLHSSWTASPLVRWLLTLAGTVYFAYWWILFFAGGLIRLGFVATVIVWLVVVLGTGYILYRQFARLSQFRARTTILIVAVLVLIGWFLWPTVCDTRESFFNIPNKQCDCYGISFPFSFRFIADGSENSMCIGWEQPVATTP